METPPSELEKFATPANSYFKESVEEWNEWTAFTVELLKKGGEEIEEMFPIVDKVMKSANHAEEEERIDSISCHGLGAVASDGPLGFFLVEFTSTPVKLTEPTNVFGCNVDPKTGRRDTMPVGSLVVKARAYKRIGRATGWYEPVDPNVEDDLYWVQHLVSGDVKAEAHSEDGSYKLTQQPAVRANKDNKEGCRFLSKEMTQ